MSLLAMPQGEAPAPLASQLALYVVLVTWGAFALPLARRLVARLYPEAPPAPVVRWSVWGVLFVLLSGLLGTFLAGWILIAAGSVEPGVVQVFTATSVLNGVVLASAMGVMWGSRSPVWAALGVGPGGNLRALVAGLGSAVVLQPALFGLAGLWSLVAPHLGIDVHTQAVLESILGASGLDLLLAGVFAVVIIPLLEELLFRGFLQPWLSRELGVGLGILTTSVAFAALHGAVVFVPIFVLSLVLGWLRQRTGRLASCWIAHAFNNALTLSIALGST